MTAETMLIKEIAKKGKPDSKNLTEDELNEPPESFQEEWGWECDSDCPHITETQSLYSKAIVYGCDKPDDAPYDTTAEAKGER